MAKVFRRLCLVCFCVVLAAILLGVCESHFAHGNEFLGCRFDKLAFDCGPGVVAGIEGLIVSLPSLLWLSPWAVVGYWNNSFSQSFPFSLLALAGAFTLILILAAVHVIRLVSRIFGWLCRVSFWIVLAITALGVFEVMETVRGVRMEHGLINIYMNYSLFGCRVGEKLLVISCDDTTLGWFREFIFNLPFALMIAPAAGLQPGILGFPEPLRSLENMDPVLVYIYMLDLVLVLAAVHVLKGTLLCAQWLLVWSRAESKSHQ
jgi:hypothetical protein